LTIGEIAKKIPSNHRSRTRSDRIENRVSMQARPPPHPRTNHQASQHNAGKSRKMRAKVVRVERVSSGQRAMGV